MSDRVGVIHVVKIIPVKRAQRSEGGWVGESYFWPRDSQRGTKARNQGALEA